MVDNWFSRVIKTAPPELSGGFFVSHLGFYDGGYLYPHNVTWLDKTVVGLVAGISNLAK